MVDDDRDRSASHTTPVTAAREHAGLPGLAEPQGSVTWYLGQFLNGDDAALQPLYARFMPRLQGLARGILMRHSVRTAGPDDAAQEALVSFWQRVRGGQFENVMHRDHLWNLLAQFTAYKTRRIVRRESARKRGGGQVVEACDLGSDARLENLLVDEPADRIDLHVAELLETLPEDLREFATLRLLGHSTEEIAELMQCTQRKVQRKLELVRLRWQQHLPQD